MMYAILALAIISALSVIYVISSSQSIWSAEKINAESPKEKIHLDANLISQTVWDQMGLPSTAQVQSRFALLKHSSSVNKFLKPVAVASNQTQQDVLHRMERKFANIDRIAAKMIRSGKRIDTSYPEYSKGILDSFEQKYQWINDSMDLLLAEKHEMKFMNKFLTLNEFLNTFRTQLDTLSYEQDKLRSPEAFLRNL